MKNIVSAVAALIFAVIILGETGAQSARDEKYVLIGTDFQDVATWLRGWGRSRDSFG